jgi:hypothetical protein
VISGVTTSGLCGPDMRPRRRAMIRIRGVRAAAAQGDAARVTGDPG